MWAVYAHLCLKVPALELLPVLLIHTCSGPVIPSRSVITGSLQGMWQEEVPFIEFIGSGIRLSVFFFFFTIKTFVA